MIYAITIPVCWELLCNMPMEVWDAYGVACPDWTTKKDAIHTELVWEVGDMEEGMEVHEALIPLLKHMQ